MGQIPCSVERISNSWCFHIFFMTPIICQNEFMYRNFTQSVLIAFGAKVYREQCAPQDSVASHSSTGSEFQTVGPRQKRPPTECATSIPRNDQTVQVGWSSMSTGDVGEWSAAVDQIPCCFVLQTPTNHDCQLVLHGFWNIEPMELVVNQRWQTRL